MIFSRTIAVLFASVILTAPMAWADAPKITVSANPEAVGDGESLALRIAVELESSESVGEPQFQAGDFQIIGQSSSMEIVTVMSNGRFLPRRKNIYSYILTPRKTGTLTVHDIKVNVGGKEYSGGSKSVQVTKGASPNQFANRGGNSGGGLPSNTQAGVDDEETDPTALVDDDPSVYKSGKTGVNFPLNSDFTVRVELSKKQAYVGEPIVVEYSLYDFGNLTRADVKRWPTFNGFFKEDLEIPNRYDFRDLVVGGRRVRRALLGRFVLFPIKPGRLEIPKLVVDGSFFTNFHGGANDPFPNFFGFRTMKQATHGNQEETVQAEPLPAAGKPDSFSGAVGKFEIAMTTDKTQVKANEPVTLKFSVTGIGNFHALEAPKLNLPKELELYETSANVQAAAARGMAQSLKRTTSFDLLVIPRSEGTFEVPGLAWSYFDTEQRAYKTLRTSPITLRVAGIAAGSSTSTPRVATDASNTAKPTGIVEAELRYLKPISELQNRRMSEQSLIRIATILLIISNLLWIGLFIVRRWTWLASLVRRKNPRRDRIQAALRDLQLFNDKGDSQALEEAINELLHLMIDQDPQGLTAQEISAIAQTKTGQERAIEELANLRTECQALRFAPNASESKRKLTELAQRATQATHIVRDAST